MYIYWNAKGLTIVLSIKVLTQHTTLLFLLIVMPNGISAGALYKWVDVNGNTHYSDVAPTNNKEQAQEINITPLNEIQSSHIKQSDFASGKKQALLDNKTPPDKPNTTQKHSAKSCFGASPQASNSTLARTQLKKVEHKNIASLFNRMEGLWRGNGVITKCTGTKAKPRIEKYNYKTTAEFNVRRSKELRVEFDMYSAKLKKEINEHIKLFLSGEHISFSRNQSDETVLLHSSDSGIELWVEQYPVHGVYKELIRIFKLQSKTMKVEQYIYADGELENSIVWNLSK